MKNRYWVKQLEVDSNLDHLIQGFCVGAEVKSRPFLTAGAKYCPRTDERQDFRFGINHPKAASMFKRQQAESQVAVTVVQCVTVMGHGNFVHAKFAELSSVLDELDQAIAESRRLTDEKKQDARGDISAIRAQFAKKNPSPFVIRGAWEGVKALPVLGNSVDYVSKVSDPLSSFLS